MSERSNPVSFLFPGGAISAALHTPLLRSRLMWVRDVTLLLHGGFLFKTDILGKKIDAAKALHKYEGEYSDTNIFFSCEVFTVMVKLPS